MNGETLGCWTAGGLLFWWCMTVPRRAAVLSLLQLKDCFKGSSPFASVKFTDYMDHFCMCAVLWALRIVTSLPDSHSWSWLGGFCVSSRKLDCILSSLPLSIVECFISLVFSNLLNKCFLYNISQGRVFPSVHSYCIVRWSHNKASTSFSERTPESHLSLDVPPGYFDWIFFLLTAWLLSGLFKPVLYLPFATRAAFQPCVLPCDLWTFELT